MAKDETQIIISQILDFLKQHTNGVHTSEIAEGISRNRITVGKYLDLLLVQKKVEIRKIGQAKVFFPVSHQSPKILIVDDEPHVRHLVALTLDDQKYQLDHAQNGKEALQKIIRQHPDVIILDIMMPEMDGFQVCEELKKNVVTQHIPIIMLSAKAQVTDKVKAMKLGADEYLTKPFDPLELEARVSAILHTKQVTRAVHPLTQLPDVAEYKKAKKQSKSSQVLYITITHMNEYIDIVGYKKAEEGLRLLVKFMVNTLESTQTFIGHKDYDTIAIIAPKAKEIQEKISTDMSNIIPYLYPDMDIKNKQVIKQGKKYPIISITYKIEKIA